MAKRLGVPTFVPPEQDPRLQEIPGSPFWKVKDEGPLVIVFQHSNFGGSAWTAREDQPEMDWWNDRISSIVVHSGTWVFFQHAHYQGAHWTLGPGSYVCVSDVGIPDNMISSFKIKRGES